MYYRLIKFIFLTIFTFLLCFSCIAQTKNKISINELFADLNEDEKLVAECEQKAREYQIAKFGKVLPKISGHCWQGCPTKIVKPHYSKEAKRLRISGQVKVETIVDENGKVIYAKILTGKSFLNKPARRAAYLSTYQPKMSCDNKPIKFRWVITYNFH